MHTTQLMRHPPRQNGTPPPHAQQHIPVAAPPATAVHVRVFLLQCSVATDPDNPHTLPVAKSFWQLVRSKFLHEPLVLASPMEHMANSVPYRAALQVCNRCHVFDYYELRAGSAHVFERCGQLLD
eukprot:690176-Prymnesium_polylepis.1